VFSKPLAALNGIVVKFMWNIIQIILIWKIMCRLLILSRHILVVWIVMV
jgi:hypothetical protein